MNDLEYYRNQGLFLEKFLRVKSFPLGIKLINNEKEAPQNAKRPILEMKNKNFMCQNFKISRSYGWTMLITPEDCICKVARMVYGWDQPSPNAIKFANEFSEGLYAKDAEISQQWIEKLYVNDKPCCGVIVSPLTRTQVIPDIIQVYCNPAQAMRLIQSYLYFKGGVLEFSAAGRGGSCHEGVIKVIQTDEPQLVILGNGDRVWGGAEDDEILFSIPSSKLSLITQGLEKTHSAGLRYPIPKYMNYTPGFQSKFKTKAKERAQGTLIKEDYE